MNVKHNVYSFHLEGARERLILQMKKRDCVLEKCALHSTSHTGGEKKGRKKKAQSIIRQNISQNTSEFVLCGCLLFGIGPPLNVAGMPSETSLEKA